MTGSRPEGDELTRVGQLAELGLLSASLLHELRQPLLAIQATAELAVAAGSADEARWRRVLDQLTHIRSLLDDYGGLSRMEGPVARVDLRHAVRTAVSTLRSRARQAGVVVQAEVGETPMPVRMRESALRQVLVNLIHNGIDAAEAGEGGRVRVRVQRSAAGVEVWVDDDGVGLPLDPEGLFRPFFTDKAEGQGTGLGLFIARTLADDAAGTVSLGPGPFGGARACLSLPLADNRG